MKKNISKLKIRNKNNHQAGFTLVETLVAIAILATTIGAFLTLTAGGFFAVRYSRNDIVANNLLQESLEYIRNSRDTDVHQGGMSWDDWLATLNTDELGNPTPINQGARGCFSKSACTVDAYVDSGNIKECSGKCPPLLFYPDQQFYGYSETYPHININGGTVPYVTSFVRTIKAKFSDTDPKQIIVTATIIWQNGTANKSLTQSIVLTNWQL